MCQETTKPLNYGGLFKKHRLLTDAQGAIVPDAMFILSFSILIIA